MVGNIVYAIVYAIGRIKDNSLHSNKEIDSDFFISISKLKQSLRVKGKKECLTLS